MLWSAKSTSGTEGLCHSGVGDIYWVYTRQSSPSPGQLFSIFVHVHLCIRVPRESHDVNQVLMSLHIYLGGGTGVLGNTRQSNPTIPRHIVASV